MKLLHLHVENFGTLSQLDMDFHEGVNEVLQENGWGKSTLAAFLRIMFYGLEGGRKKELSENDRMKYKPWNQGAFGGSLEFEADGKQYLVTRSFGQKEKDATFRLQDAVTLLDSKDYSDRLGEELFGIDRESFEKTSFIDSTLIRYRGINSTIGSKVGSISQTDDLNNYDAAQEKMKNYLNANSPKKRTGSLYQLEDEIKELERDLKKQEPAQQRAAGVKEHREKEQEKLQQCKVEREQAQRELNGLSEKRSLLMNQKRKAELETAAKSRLEALQASQAAFGKRIPTREELRDLNIKAEVVKKHAIRVESMGQHVENERLERLRRYFKHGIPGEQEITKQITYCNDVQDGLQRKLHVEEQLDAEKRSMDDAQLELQRLEAAASIENANKRKALLKKRGIAAASLGVGVILGILIIALRLPILLLGLAIALVVLGLGMLLLSLTRAYVKEDAPISEVQLLRNRQKERADRIQKLQQDLQALGGDVREKENAVRSFLEQREIIYSRADAENLLYEMKNRRAEYLSLLREEEEKKMAEKKLEEEGAMLRQHLTACLQGMELSFVPAQYDAILAWIGETMQRLISYENEYREEESARKTLQDYMATHPELGQQDLSELSEEKLKELEQVYSSQIQEFSRQETALHETISAYTRDLDEAYGELEDLREKQEKLEALKEQRDMMTTHYRLVEKTQEYLRVAKEQFIARFMQPIKTAFDGYYELMTGQPGSGNEFQIDANMNIFRKEAGEYHDVEAQSEGYGDMIGLCIRMALLDVMYEKEGPLVIMDDPFVNLDQEHLEGAQRFLETISKKYQILYLTCHEARSSVNL